MMIDFDQSDPQNESDIERLLHWMDLIDRDVHVHFNSWSWKIGWWIVRAIKLLTLNDHRPASQYRIQQVLKTYRIWKSQYFPSEQYFKPVRAKAFDITLLIGERCHDLSNVGNMLGQKTVQTIGFGDPTSCLTSNEADDSIIFFKLCSFPLFFDSLTRALLAIKGEKIIVCNRSIGGLGLGFLANYHFHKPLSFRFSDLDPRKEMEKAWNEEELIDPCHSKWISLLHYYYRKTKKPLNIDMQTISKEFAEDFACFYKSSTF